MKKILKNLLIILSVILLITPSNLSASANSKIENTIYNSNGYTFEIQTDNESYQNIKVINDKTQEIEYLEVVKEKDGSYSYKATSEAQILEINSTEKKH